MEEESGSAKLRHTQIKEIICSSEHFEEKKKERKKQEKKQIECVQSGEREKSKLRKKKH